MTAEVCDSEKALEILETLQVSKLEMITYSNVAVWTPDSKQLHFSLPVDRSVPAAQMRFLRVTKPATAQEEADIRQSGRLLFTNKVWDALEEALEEGDEAEEEGEEVEEVEVEEAVAVVGAPEPPAPNQEPPQGETTEEVPATEAEEEEKGGEEHEEDEDDDEADGQMNVLAAMQWVFSELRKPGARLFTTLTSEAARKILATKIDD